LTAIGLPGFSGLDKFAAKKTDNHWRARSFFLISAVLMVNSIMEE
jgi:hypothetical protein